MRHIVLDSFLEKNNKSKIIEIYIRVIVSCALCNFFMYHFFAMCSFFLL